MDDYLEFDFGMKLLRISLTVDDKNYKLIADDLTSLRKDAKELIDENRRLKERLRDDE